MRAPLASPLSLSPRLYRRALLTVPLLPALPASAEPETASWPATVLVSVSLQDVAVASDQAVPSAAALYDTLRPAGSRAGPVAARRIPLNGRLLLPMRLELGSADGLPDAPPLAEWWLQPLLVSARLDSDGVAATRDPEDLVGRVVAQAGRGGYGTAELPLQGRGLGGRLVTQRSK